MMQTCNKKLQKRGKAPALQCKACLAVVQAMHLCILTHWALCTLQTRRRFRGKGCSLQLSMCQGAQVQPQPLQLLRALSEKSRSIRLMCSCLHACVRTRYRAPSHHRHWLKGRLTNFTETPSPQNSLESFILRGKEKVKRQTTERRELA